METINRLTADTSDGAKQIPPSGDMPEDFEEGQWWLKELDAMVVNGTHDQKRAVAVVRNLMTTAKAQQPQSEPRKAGVARTCPFCNEELVEQPQARPDFTDEWAGYLKDGEAPFERFLRERKDMQSVLKLYQRVLEENERLKAQQPQAEASTRNGIDAAKLLAKTLKPEEIGADPVTQHKRIQELLHWFIRLADGNANPKWLHGHSFELAYYIATHAVSRHVDLKAAETAAYVEGFNVPANERAMLNRIDPVKFHTKAPQQAEAALQWCQDCGEGYVDFCRVKSNACKMKPKAE